MNFGNTTDPKHHNVNVSRQVTTDHLTLSQSVPTDDNLDCLNGKDSGITSLVVEDSISIQSSLMMTANKKTKRQQPQESSSNNNISGTDSKAILEEEITHLKAKLA